MISDQDLVEAYTGRGDREALEALFDRYRGGVYRATRRILRNEADALDATQATFLNAMRGLGALKERAKIRAWLRRIAVNVALEMKRSQGPRDPWEELARARSFNDPGGTAESVQEDLEVVRKALDELPEEYRLPIVLHYFEGLSYDEIAKALACPRGTVGTNIHRGMERLRALFTPSGLAIAGRLFDLFGGARSGAVDLFSDLACAPPRAPASEGAAPDQLA